MAMEIETKTLKSKHNSDPAALHNFIDIICKDIICGIKHGFFKYEIECEIATGKKRQLIYRAGKSHRFIISEQEAGNL